ncbi:hypothetical protein Spith_0164 [Spirochaeta thermophila DSM 6578]|uniref:Porin domain-containing protein n=1 Tax=Winmispira thermophila (strain ATCC 700085 / DSM 6578 / Z-1203) TaxID=869211 RepID=G0GCN2_WINT7|nr:hypothetical protein [Spirochaeta thermophila]AEJ60451.1 hypothetical protein Spith_0164 [Spirochaeta thermophila DSM 6578]
MKRGLLLLLAMALVVGYAFADSQVDYSISGSATATIGYDLDGKTFGIKNETSADLTITFVEGSEEKGGEGTVYGWISLSGFSAKAGNNIVEEDVVFYDADDNDVTDSVKNNLGVDSIKAKSDFVITPPSITAKLMMGPAYLLITTKGADIDKASLDPDFIKEEAFGGNDVAASSFEDNDYNNLTLGVDTDVVDASVTLGTEDDWNGDSENAGLVAGEVSVSVAGATLGVNVSGLFGNNGGSIGEDADNPLAVGVNASYAASVGEGLSITPSVAYDLVKKGDALAHDILGGLSVGYNGLSTSVNVLYVIPAENQYKLLVKGSVSDGGMIPVVDVSLNGEYGMMDTDTEASAFALKADLSAGLGVAKPFVGVIYEQTLTEGVSGDDQSDFMMQVGTDITAVQNTTFTLKYASGDLTHEESAADYTADVFANDSGARLGEITFAIKISY